MIKGINSSGRYITVSGGSSATPYISPGAAGAGMVRFNPNMNQLEVNDGNSWIRIDTSYATVELNQEAESLLDWARRERNKQLEREAKIKDNPALQKAYEAIKRAEENFDLLEAIAGNYNSDDQTESA
jgi:hypothetical protein